MAKNSIDRLFLVLMAVFLIGCATAKPHTTFETIDLNPKLQSGDYVQKVDNFVVILDATSSMDVSFSRAEPTKLSLAKDIVSRMNQTIPDLKLTGGLRTLGTEWCRPFGKKTTLVYGLTPYSQAGLEEGLNQVRWACGRSPLEIAIDATSEDLKSTEGDIAVIIVSDGEDMDDAPVAAAQNMKSVYSDRVCIYTVVVGAGKEVLERVAQVGRCGFSVSADDIASSEAMADLVEKVFFERVVVRDSDGDGVLDNIDRCPNTPKGVAVDSHGCPLDTDGDGVYDYLDKCPNTPKGVRVDLKGCPVDSDGDGVYDYMDQCPGTPVGARVNAKGCWVLEGVDFDTDKWEIKPEDYAILDEVVAVLKRNPTLRVEIEGHTDNRGSEVYNKKLSEKRAEAVKNYFMNKGIEAKRLSAGGYGFSRPVASNDRREGRAQNRRVELTPIP